MLRVSLRVLRGRVAAPWAVRAMGTSASVPLRRGSAAIAAAGLAASGAVAVAALLSDPADCSWYNPLSWFGSSTNWKAVQDDIEAIMADMEVDGAPARQWGMPPSHRIPTFGLTPLLCFSLAGQMPGPLLVRLAWHCSGRASFHGLPCACRHSSSLFPCTYPIGLLLRLRCNKRGDSLGCC
jgi:hypothetical protein